MTPWLVQIIFTGKLKLNFLYFLCHKPAEGSENVGIILDSLVKSSQLSALSLKRDSVA